MKTDKYITFEEILSKKTLNIFWIIIDNKKNELKFNKNRKKNKINLEKEIDLLRSLDNEIDLKFTNDSIEIKLKENLTTEDKSNIIWKILEILNKDYDI